jgi:hypothetical protein
VHLTVFGRIYLKGVKFRPGYIDRPLPAPSAARVG